MELIAKLKTVHGIIERNNFKSRKVWVTTEDNPQYPQTVEVEVTQDKSEMFATVTPGSEVKLYINLRGREWTNPEGKTSVFNTLAVWKIDVLNKAFVEPLDYIAPTKADLNNDLPF